MTDKPRWTRERKPKRRTVRAEVGKRQLREQLRVALEDRARLQQQLAEQDARGLRLAEENERLREGLEAVLAYVPQGFISPMDDEDTLNVRAIARAALKRIEGEVIAEDISSR